MVSTTKMVVKTIKEANSLEDLKILSNLIRFLDIPGYRKGAVKKMLSNAQRN